MSDGMEQDSKHKNSISLRFDLRIVTVALLVVILGMLALWRPWTSTPTDTTRTISVTGNSTVTATPDEYVFSPTYEFQNADKTAAIQQVTDKQTAVVAGLKKLGVTDSQIKASSDGYESDYGQPSSGYTYTLSLTVTINDKTRSQQVQDYLAGTGPDGQVSPTADFSNALQKKLESQARDAATKEARAKADQSAKNLGFTVGKVKSVDDSGFDGGGVCGSGFLCPLNATAGSADTKSSTLSVQPGQNDLSYSVTVVYYVR